MCCPRAYSNPQFCNKTSLVFVRRVLWLGCACLRWLLGLCSSLPSTTCLYIKPKWHSTLLRTCCFWNTQGTTQRRLSLKSMGACLFCLKSGVVASVNVVNDLNTNQVIGFSLLWWQMGCVSSHKDHFGTLHTPCSPKSKMYVSFLASH